MQLPAYPIFCNKNHDEIYHADKECPLCFIIEQLRIANETILRYQQIHPLPKQKVYTTEEISVLHKREVRIVELERENEKLYGKLIDYGETIQHLQNEVHELKNPE